ncbi:deoxyribodipyrimidine photo-lyase [Rubellicoccus peritrichatus]|uniref:Deoxyribodipyrimidine photo-lyase n=1 Tax=Rubellicoccus peritrichatus TaxID=3080537 RepID=A0AAQ3QTE5_9BACT|nr:deoxyribodipyrimidine photo-lyase [Puniceicoccus sp. CR14]WOO41251.1 deoxyribodipyrimidine photo-lyase [Puniceicoccus sp. CR14]
MSVNAPTLLWFRLDLRLDDNPAMQAAIARGKPIIPVFIYDEDKDWPLGGATRWWLHHALADLQEQLSCHGLKLVLQSGDSAEVISDLVEKHEIGAVFWNRCYEPRTIARDSAIKQQLKSQTIEVESFNTSLLFEPWEIKNKTGNPFRVFTPFWKHCLAKSFPKTINCDLGATKVPRAWPDSEILDDWKLLPRISWDAEFYKFWKPTRKAGLNRLRQFVKDAVHDYGNGRDRPDWDGTSCLSPYLHFGQIGPREIYEALLGKVDLTKGGPRQYLSEIGWREFSYHILYHFPSVPTEPLRPEFEHFPWEPDDQLLKAWQKGQTGYPLVDAGMRQLYAIGWMHNRVRMNAGSILVKHLLQPWQDGARWFWDTLVDADLASNTQGWQWTAGCGADGAPYFRVFNPVLQGQRFDTEGDYVRRWVPELAKLPSQYIHQPWEAPDSVLAAADVKLCKTYPLPVVEHQQGRRRALDAYEKLKFFHKDKK